MTITEVRSEAVVETPKRATVDMKFEIVVIPLRAKAFYDDCPYVGIGDT